MVGYRDNQRQELWEKSLDKIDSLVLACAEFRTFAFIVSCPYVFVTPLWFASILLLSLFLSLRRARLLRLSNGL